MKTLLLAALAATTPLVPVTAETVQATRTVAVHDLDLSRPGHRTRLDRRLTLAARDVCGEASALDLVGKRRVQRCRIDVLERARPARDRALARAGGATEWAGR
ncbi:UrcA family protein [Sphingomonas corticis]|uniref:UrcA family protein n=1 Tax=Sphingomonas corticis TaxID=2722791 RepID=A0ABX1CSC4_9SPHN|nr:UrcA family protein [Sphingomonas corticis]NJR79312.1 UrcA family protein [Sphingomonas corticis]